MHLLYLILRLMSKPAVKSLLVDSIDLIPLNPSMFTLPNLPYPLTALEPHISAKTLEFHHGKHHATYTTKLNEALAGLDNLLNMEIEELLVDLSNLVPTDRLNGVRNNGAQFYNHSLYWESMSPQGGGLPTGQLSELITQQYGSFEAFKAEFIAAGITQFGSGWAWLSVDSNGQLSIDKTSNEDTPLMHGKTPLLTMDVWEHAYYLDYQNRRPDYIAGFFEVVDWESANRRLLDTLAK
jgi:superoxide dismutase, Fe-Mn family